MGRDEGGGGGGEREREEREIPLDSAAVNQHKNVNTEFQKQAQCCISRVKIIMKPRTVLTCLISV